MNNYDFRQYKLRGDISHRLLMSFCRLESEYYTPDYIFSADVSGWPGDWEGRTMLALVRLSEATGKEPSYLEEIMDQLDERLNEQGFFGTIHPIGTIDEQQLSGHNWFLRALLEYYRIHRCPKVLERIQKLIRNLYLPVRGFYDVYPLDPEVRGRTGRYDGSITGKSGNWYTSSDIGCAYMCLDGLAMAFDMLRDPDVKELLDEMIENFVKIDFVGASMQTHATLSAVRGIIRLYAATGEARYLQIARDIFALYESYGMTENYANQNWFNRPNTWTEPCAIIDSYMCAIRLFELTREIHYLELSHKIYYNAIGFAQRPTGGFGCDVCAGFDTDFIRPHAKGLCEAVWCCTMRGGEGLAEYAKHLFAYEDDRVYLLNYNPSSLCADTFHLDIRTKYPYEGTVDISARNDGEEKLLCLFIPSYLREEEVKLSVDGQSQPCKIRDGFAEAALSRGVHTVSLRFEIPLLKTPTFMKMATPDRCQYNHGFLLLGCDSGYTIRVSEKTVLTPLGKGRYRMDNGCNLMPINDILFCKEEDVQSPRQILFPKI